MPEPVCGRRLTSQDAILVAFRALALIKPLGGRRKPQRMLRCLHVRPAPIRMAIFAIALALTLAMAELRTVHTATIGGIVAHRGKAADRPGFQGDGLRSYRAETRHSEQLLIGRRGLQTRLDGLFQGFDLAAQIVEDRQAARHRQALVRLRQQAFELSLR